MRFPRTNWFTCDAKRSRAAFTLVEALAALAFLAIVIPVAVEGLRVASLAGQMALRKTEAARVADRMLGELIATGQWKQGSSGTVREGVREFRWKVQSQAWDKDALKLVTVQVTYAVQNQDYDLSVSTLLDPDAL
jgi:type II secretory pathway pseudopilin PulG